MPDKLINIPTNLIMGFLGVGKTTAILDLLKQKPENEKWAVLVNEFGQVGIDGAIFSTAGATVKEITGGCLCCAVAAPFQVGINQLLKVVRPDRLLIEPSGLGHPKNVVDMLVNDTFKEVLELRAGICLVDPQKLKDKRYTTHKNFIDQIVLSDVLVANKMDLADAVAAKLFHRWADESRPGKAMIAQTTQGQLDVAWLDISRNQQRLAVYPNAHQTTDIHPENKQPQLNNYADGYQSFGYIFTAECCFDFRELIQLLGQLKVERIKAIVLTDKGWFIMNSAGGEINNTATLPAASSRIEIIAMQDIALDLSTELDLCRIDKSAQQ